MATTPLENIVGDAAGRPNLVIYLGPTLALAGAGSPVTALNTLAIDRFNASTGAKESYVPGGGSNPFTTMDAGYGSVHGRVYIIHAKASYVFPNCAPGAPIEEV